MLPPVKVSSTRRWWKVEPRKILFAIIAALLVMAVMDRVWIRGEGVVAGELTAIAPIVQARLAQRFVKCLDHVKRGQRVAEFVNEATIQNAEQQTLALKLQLTQTMESIRIADSAAKAAAKLVDAQNAVLKIQMAVLKAEDSLVKSKFVATLVWEQAKAAVAKADADVKSAEFVYETKLAQKRQAELDAEVLQKRIDSFKNAPELNGHFFVTAPKDGIVTECTVRPGEVVAARTPIFSIFNVEDTYAVVFFDPGFSSRIERGQIFDMKIQGVDGNVRGVVDDFFPELSALPASLTRFFWQQERWSQYVPVRLKFVDMSSAQTLRLFASAQLSASAFDLFGLLRGGSAAPASVPASETVKRPPRARSLEQPATQ